MNLQLKMIPLVVTLALTGCSKQTPEELIFQAETKLESKQVAGAIIDLKNVIQQEPQNAKARLLLGTIYVETGSAALAEKEFNNIVNNDELSEQVLPLLVKAYALQGKNEELVDFVNSLKLREFSDGAQSSLLLYKALAYMNLNMNANAMKAIREATEISSDSLYSQLGTAYKEFSANNVSNALGIVDTLLASQPNFVEALMLKGQLSLLNEDYSSAVESFEKYFEQLPNLPLARLFLADAYIKNQQYKKAEEQLSFLLKSSPNQPYVNELLSLVKYQELDFQSAKLYSEKAILNGRDTTSNRIIAGISAYQLGNFEQAYDHFSSVEKDLTKNQDIQRLYIMTKLKLGYSTEALDLIAQMDLISNKDFELIANVSLDLVRKGERDKAKELINMSDDVELSTPRQLTQLGLLQLSLNDIDGLVNIKKALELDPQFKGAKVALVQSLLGSGEYQAAVAQAEIWLLDEPDDLSLQELQALGYFKLKDYQKATESYSNILLKYPNNSVARMFFVEKAIEDGDLNKANQLVQKLVIDSPFNIQALIKMYILSEQVGGNGRADSLKKIESAYQANSNIFEYSLLYASVLMTEQKFAEAIGVLDNVDRNAKRPPLFWATYADALLFIGEYGRAKLVVAEWISKHPNQSSAYLRLINLDDVTEDYANGIKNVERALKLFPEDQKLVLQKIYFSLQLGMFDKVEAGLQSYSGKDYPLVYLIKAKLAESKGQMIPALGWYNKLYDAKPTSLTATSIANVLLKSGKMQELESFVDSHLSNYEDDSGLRLLVATNFASNNPSGAVIQYEKVLLSEPNNVVALNNLALLKIQSGDFKRAEVLAVKANQVMPKVPEILDTLASALIGQKRFKDAEKTLNEAVSLNNNNVEIVINLVNVLVINDKIDDAKKILNNLQNRVKNREKEWVDRKLVEINSL